MDMTFDVSRPWVILAPPGRTARLAAEELGRGLGALRGTGAGPVLADASTGAPGEEVPVAVLNASGGGPLRGGFTWRLGRDRLEIFGDSERGLFVGAADFLAALGFRWPAPGREELPPLRPEGVYALEADRRYVPSKTAPAGRRRLVLGLRDIPAGRAPDGGLTGGEALVRWALRRGIDALVLSLREECSLPVRLAGFGGRRRRELMRAAADYGLPVEAGGWDLSLLLPRRYFFFHRELFRMDSGRRRGDFNFCPTNPGTIRLLERRAEKLFRSRPGTEVFHLWPDRPGEGAWCSCPNCRAFSPAEQNRIAVNAAARVLAAVDGGAWLSCYEDAAGDGGEDCGIPLRGNVFTLKNTQADLLCKVLGPSS